LLVPDILQARRARPEWDFLHGLAEISAEVPHQKLNGELLLECCERASEAARTDAHACLCLAALSRLYLADARDNGADFYGFVLTLAGECFKGKLPLSFLSDLLDIFHGPERSAWSKSDLNRLPTLIAFQALLAEVDIDDWFNLGRAFPVLNAVLSLEHRWHWLQCYALWDQRSRRPWASVGEAKTLFELAKSPGEFEDLLSFYPDVLLYVARANLVVGSKGIWIEGVCIPAHQVGTDVTMQRVNGSFELQVGVLRIRCAENPRAFLNDVQRWLNWYFLDFVPTVSSAPRPLTESRHRMWHLSKMTCPECSRTLVPCPGDLGVALR
jgi:hypothetical protein